MQETIAAIATPPGEGGLHLIRLSGPQALSLAAQLFFPAGAAAVTPFAHQRAIFGEIRDPATGQGLDEVILTAFHAPHSYTAEDVVEISCHGGVLVSQRILERVIDQGARPAGPGEFTRRAFVNGRLDLAQAEAVADLIHAASDRAMAAALNQLRGGLSAKLNAWYARLMGVLAQLETAIDFPEEGLEFKQKQALLAEVRQVETAIEDLLATFRQGKIFRDGLQVVLLGKPNAGKSSLLNQLLREERAIVTHFPGTTRDVLAERVRLKDIHITLLDTAGIRQEPEVIEEEGIRRTRQALDRADLALVVLDGSRPADADDACLLEAVGGTPACLAVNKIDLPRRLDLEPILAQMGHPETLDICATRGTGIPALEDALYQTALTGAGRRQEGVVLTRERHRAVLAAAHTALGRVGESLAADLSEDLVAVDLNQAQHLLGGLLGKQFDIDLLDRIFDDFCIGK
ncbi:MAG: tRNA uridine-5-carboxymethylaminomethyl(34) synthesis GTPase MnmE [Nitrospinaceae bacterium]